MRYANAIVDAGFSADTYSFLVARLSVEISCNESARDRSVRIRTTTYHLAEAMKVGAETPLAVNNPLVWA
ncbi:MAG TPA: hypothetical protein VMW30_05940 [Candidatus Paceibacterota bacterium]|nr:hypothetical protein [Candidatus Paceibacterota bacterium]